MNIIQRYWYFLGLRTVGTTEFRVYLPSMNPNILPIRFGNKSQNSLNDSTFCSWPRKLDYLVREQQTKRQSKKLQARTAHTPYTFCSRCFGNSVTFFRNRSSWSKYSMQTTSPSKGGCWHVGNYSGDLQNWNKLYENQRQENKTLQRQCGRSVSVSVLLLLSSVDLEGVAF